MKLYELQWYDHGTEWIAARTAIEALLLSPFATDWLQDQKLDNRDDLREIPSSEWDKPIPLKDAEVSFKVWMEAHPAPGVVAISTSE